MTRAFDIGPADLPGTGYLPMAAFQIPVISGLKGAFLFGSGLDVASLNWAAGGNDAAVIGSPTVGNGFLTFDLNAYLQTDIAETAAQTFVIVARRPADAAVGYIGNYGGSVAWGVSLYSSAGTSLMNSTSSRGGAAGGIGVSGTVADFGLYALTVPATGQSRIDDLTEGTANLAASGSRTINGGGAHRIGRVYSGTFAGQTDQVLAMIYDRALSDAERLAVADWARIYAASVGITV